MMDLGIWCFGKTTVRGSWYINHQIKANKLYYVYSGYAYCDGTMLTQGNLYIISDNADHKWQLGKDFKHFFIDFTVMPQLTAKDIVTIKVANHPVLEHFIKAYTALLNSTQSIDDDFSVSLLNTLLHLCNEITPIFATPSGRIYEIISYMNSSPDILTIEQLSKLFNMDKYYFIKLFKKETGVTPHKYMNNLRLEKAFTALKNGCDVKSLAFECGFSSQSAFSNTFKKKFGISPSQIKKLK